MKELVPKDEYGIFADAHDIARVDSLFVAKTFEKKHTHVLRDIGKITEPKSGLSEEFVKTNFMKDFYRDATGRRLPCYQMARDGFTMLVMGYTGQKAMRFKEKYIHRFNEMESFIKTLVSARHDFPELTAAVQMAHDDPKPYHYSNECNLLCSLVTGMTAKQFREAHGIQKGESIRPFLSAEQIKMLDKLQKADIGLLVAVPDYQKRKEALEQYRDKLEAKAKLKSAAR